MRVFLIPVGGECHEPYCEVEEGQVQVDDRAARQGIFRRFWERFSEMLQAAERAQRDRDMADGHRSTGGRLSDRVLGWVAERIAEQRLLWHLRRHDTATLVHPSDVDGQRADAMLRGHLRREADRHRRWLFIDGLITLVTGPLLFFVPGPNLVAYYFAFRAVGHFLSHRGARHGLDRVTWQLEPSGPLAELRLAATLDPATRAPRVRDLAGQLQLAHLQTFFERMVLPRA